jgi:uncharacterized repeat protein (TIGR01451 family)
MFRKIVSNLPFSPALVGQLSFYAKRLRKEEFTRRLGLIFTALALVVQSLAVFSPPEAANASSGNDFISGGVKNINDYLRNYDANHNNIKDLFTVLGITRANIAAARTQEINSKTTYSWGLMSRFSAIDGERTYTIGTSSGGTRTFYNRPLKAWDTGNNIKTGSYYKAFVGRTDTGMWFALMYACGNLVLQSIPPVPPCPAGTTGTYPNCTPEIRKCSVPGKENLPENSPNCKPDPEASCSLLTISPLTDNRYQFDGKASAKYGATIKSYTYVVKRDGKLIDTKTVSSTSEINSYIYTQAEKGNYTVELTVDTSLGNQNGANCISSFNVTPPEMCTVNPSLPKSSPDCQPCPGNETIWIKDPKCKAELVQTKVANNISQNNVNATTVTAKAGDKVSYTITVENKGERDATNVQLKENLADLLEYSGLIDNGNGTFNSTDKTLSWNPVAIKAKSKESRTFVVQLLNTIPTTNTGKSDQSSYDCVMTNAFGNSVNINVACPVEKVVVEQTVTELPHTGPRENMIFAGILGAVVVYFWARSRQLGKEVRLIRRDVHAGAI